MATLALESSAARQSRISLRQSSAEEAARRRRLVMHRPSAAAKKLDCVTANHFHLHPHQHHPNMQLQSTSCGAQLQSTVLDQPKTRRLTRSSAAYVNCDDNKPSFWRSSTSLLAAGPSSTAAAVSVGRCRVPASAQPPKATSANGAMHHRLATASIVISSRQNAGSINRIAPAQLGETTTTTRTSRQEQARRGRHLANRTLARRASCDFIHLKREQNNSSSGVRTRNNAAQSSGPAQQTSSASASNSRLRQGALYARRQVYLQPTTTTPRPSLRGADPISVVLAATNRQYSASANQLGTSSQQRHQLASTLHKQRLRRGASLLAVTPRDFQRAISMKTLTSTTETTTTTTTTTNNNTTLAAAAATARSALVEAIRKRHSPNSGSCSRQIPSRGQFDRISPTTSNSINCQRHQQNLNNNNNNNNKTMQRHPLDSFLFDNNNNKQHKLRPTSKLTSSTSSLTLAVVKRPRQNPPPRVSCRSSHETTTTKLATNNNSRRWSAGLDDSAESSSSSSHAGVGGSSTRSSATSSSSLCSNTSSTLFNQVKNNNIRASSENRSLRSTGVEAAGGGGGEAASGHSWQRETQRRRRASSGTATATAAEAEATVSEPAALLLCGGGDSVTSSQPNEEEHQSQRQPQRRRSSATSAQMSPSTLLVGKQQKNVASTFKPETNNKQMPLKQIDNPRLVTPSIDKHITLATRNNNIVDIPIRLEPISDYYDLEARPFARGKFAQVKRCVPKGNSSQSYAAKCIRKRKRQTDMRNEILLEIEALKLSYQTDYIVKLYEVYETTSEMILVLEMANGGELQRVLDDEEQLDEAIVCRFVKQILDGLIFLHDNQIAHLDIKPQNLLLTEPYPDGNIKLCDFGISRRITDGCEVRDICGTPDYVAPEILRYDPISLATDMWSLGVLTYVLLSGYSPFGSENKQQTFCNITQGPLDFPEEIFGKISSNAIDFVQRLIVREPRDRLTSRQARKHNWFNLWQQIPDQF